MGTVPHWDICVNHPQMCTIDGYLSEMLRCVAMNMPVITTGRRLAMAREDAGLSVNQMADRLRVDRRTITRYERGRGVVPPAILLAYQVICDVPADFIEGRAALTQETVSSRCTGECPCQGTLCGQAA